MNRLQEFSGIVQNSLRRPVDNLGDEGVFVMSDLRSAGAAKDYRDNIEAAMAVLYVITREEITGGFFQSGFFGRGDGILDIGEFFIGLRSDLDENDATVGIDHYQVNLAGPAGKIPRKDFETFAFEELLACFLSPTAELFPVI